MAAGLSIVDGHAYVTMTKTNSGSKYPVSLAKITNVESSSHTITYTSMSSGSSANIAKHANGLTHGNGKFYMATMNDSSGHIVGFNSPGVVSESISKGSYTVSGISYYGVKNSKYLFLVEQKSGDSYIYHLVYFANSAIVNYKASYWTINLSSTSYTSASGYEGNGFYYDRDTGHLHKIMSKTGESPINKNAILEFAYGTSSAVRILQDDGASGHIYEIEGMAIYNSKKYVCAKVSTTGCTSDIQSKLYKLHT